MLNIPCPHCGHRPQTEFTYGGDASVRRPDAQTASQQEWLEHIYIRDNSPGDHLEWWHHVSGCRQWIKIRRNVSSHRISAGAPAQANPEITE